MHKTIWLQCSEHNAAKMTTFRHKGENVPTLLTHHHPNIFTCTLTAWASLFMGLNKNSYFPFFLAAQLPQTCPEGGRLKYAHTSNLNCKYTSVPKCELTFLCPRSLIFHNTSLHSHTHTHCMSGYDPFFYNLAWH